MEHIVAAYARKKFRMTKYHVKSQLLDWVYINIQMNRGQDRGKSEFLNSQKNDQLFKNRFSENL